MKFNVFAEKDKGSYWVLSNGTFSFKSQSFETRPQAIKDLERFVTSIELPVFIKPGEDIRIHEESNSPLLVITFENSGKLWRWDAWVSAKGNSSKIASHTAGGFDTINSACEDSKFLRNTIIGAPILDQADVAIPNMHFSKAFADDHGIGDIHPSSKFFR